MKKTAVPLLLTILAAVFILAGCPGPADEGSNGMMEEKFPIISLFYGETEIENGDALNLGSYSVIDDGPTPFVFVFTLANSGDAELNLTGEEIVQISGDHPDDFSVGDEPVFPIEPDASSDFTIEFESSFLYETRRATITVEGDDADEESFTFSIAAIGTQ